MRNRFFKFEGSKNHWIKGGVENSGLALMIIENNELLYDFHFLLVIFYIKIDNNINNIKSTTF